MKPSELSPRRHVLSRSMNSPREDDAANQSQPIIQVNRKAKPTIPRLLMNNIRCSSSNNLTGPKDGFRNQDFIQVYLRMRPPLPNEKTYEYSVENNTITLYPRHSNVSNLHFLPPHMQAGLSGFFSIM